jgi:ABC-2 type transport system ATP-binding protein
MQTDSEIAIRAAGVNKRYGRVAALSDLDLAVRAGLTFGLVGANGAGKTTLIKCLLNFCAFDAGQIEIFGLPSTRTSARSRLAFLPERFNPPYYLTGEDFLRLMLKMYGRQYDRDAVEAMLHGLDLDGGVLGKPVRTFSKGMTQKLGLAACLLSGRDLLVLDEPTGGLDPKARALLKRCLRQARALGGTVFLTSHALADVEEICDEMAVLHEGRVRFTGEPMALKQQYGATNLEEAYLECIA